MSVYLASSHRAFKEGIWPRDEWAIFRVDNDEIEMAGFCCRRSAADYTSARGWTIKRKRT